MFLPRTDDELWRDHLKRYGLGNGIPVRVADPESEGSGKYVLDDTQSPYLARTCCVACPLPADDYDAFWYCPWCSTRIKASRDICIHCGTRPAEAERCAVLRASILSVA